MKNSRIVSGVKIVAVANGRFEYHIPSTMNGTAFTAWSKDNAKAIETAKDELSDQDAEGDASVDGRAVRYVF